VRAEVGEVGVVDGGQGPIRAVTSPAMSPGKTSMSIRTSQPCSLAACLWISISRRRRRTGTDTRPAWPSSRRMEWMWLRVGGCDCQVLKSSSQFLIVLFEINLMIFSVSDFLFLNRNFTL